MAKKISENLSCYTDYNSVKEKKVLDTPTPTKYSYIIFGILLWVVIIVIVARIALLYF